MTYLVLKEVAWIQSKNGTDVSAYLAEAESFIKSHWKSGVVDAILGEDVALGPFIEDFAKLIVYQPLSNAADAFLLDGPDPGLTHPREASFYLDVLFHAKFTGHWDLNRRRQW